MTKYPLLIFGASAASLDGCPSGTVAVAYLVTARLNLDIGSAAYLANYVTADNALPNYSLDSVLKAAGKIEEMLGGRFRPKRRKSKQTG